MEKNSLVFATKNSNKIAEINAILRGHHSFDIFPTVIGLNDINCREEIPEDSDTITGNAIQKATYIHKRYAINCFAEDTGLQIEALNGEPGVFSARYAGDDRNADKNMKLVLAKLGEIKNRRAQFKTTIALYFFNVLHLFEGVVKGNITLDKMGKEGFGYDPIFLPNESTKTFGQMTAEEKNRISHRRLALDKMLNFLESQITKSTINNPQ